MNFKFSNLLGAPYRGGNLLLSSANTLLSPVGNRVAITDLIKSETTTLPCENAKNVSRIALSPNGALLLSVDEDGRCLLINVHRRITLHRLSFKSPVSAIQFSPDGSLFAVSSGKLLQIWRTPSFKKEFFPFQLLRTFARCHDTVTSIAWSPDSKWILAGSKDLIARLFTVEKFEDFSPVMLMGHRDVVVGVFFTKEKKTGDVSGAYTVSQDGALITWTFHAAAEVDDSNSALSSELIQSNPTPECPEEVRIGSGSLKSGTQATGEDHEEENADFEIILNPSDEVTALESSEKTNGNIVSALEKKRKKRKRQKEEGAQTTNDHNRDGASNNATTKQASLILTDMKTTRLDKGRWELTKKDFFMQNAKVTTCDYHPTLNLLVVGFASGNFGLYQMPEFTCIHMLSISREKITTAVFNEIGNWLAFGCAKLGQLLVWEWRSESYILKQQGHYFDVNCVAYSPDSQLLATGADDNKLKIWNATSGFCFVTFAEHTNAVTAVHFLPGNHALLSASLDGTVRAWDLLRYRNFRTFTTPSMTQFVSLAADQSGEIICAGSLDSFQVYVWSMKTGRLLDILSGHEGPVRGLAFSPVHGMLASSSWDKTVRLWDIFDGKGSVETFQHNHDVLTVAYRPDGKQLACTTLDGQIHLWDPIEGQLIGTIEGRRDIAGGRLIGDRRTAANSSSGKCFTSICYTADGSFLLAGGSSKYICMYDVSEKVLLRRFQITHNRSLDGVLDFLNSKRMTDAGPLDLIDDEDSNAEEGNLYQVRGQLGYGLPGTIINSGKPIVRTKCLQISPTGRSWVAATTEGVLVYSMDDCLVFDPIDLDIDVTPQAVVTALKEGQYSRALILALRLNESYLIRFCLESAFPSEIGSILSAIPTSYLSRLLDGLAEYLDNSPHLELLLLWCQELCRVHGKVIQQQYKELLPHLRSLQKTITKLHEDLGSSCSENRYMLEYICTAPS